MSKKQIDALRARIAAHSAEIQSLEAYTRSPAEIERAARARVQDIEGRGLRALQGALGAMAEGASFAGLNPRDPADLAPLLVALVGADAVSARLAALIAGMPPGLDTAPRNARIAELRAERFQLELAEEAAIVAAEARGEWIARRPDADPAAVLYRVEG